MGLKRKTGLAMPTLIIAANIPDIDAVTVLLGGQQHLALRRGITHGPAAMVLLPLLLWGAMLWFDRWQTKRGTRPEERLPVRKGWLLALAFIGCLSHPLFDWFNSYGIRLLEPFSSQWFYGDALFIVDPWIISTLSVGIWYSLRRERAGKVAWRWPANLMAGLMVLYILFNMLTSSVALFFYDGPSFAVANPVPVEFWKREVLFRDDCSVLAKRRCPEHYGRWIDSIVAERPSSHHKFGPTNMKDPRIAAWAKRDPEAQAFLFWSRMPVAELHPNRIVLRDQRFMDPRVADRFSITLRPPK